MWTGQGLAADPPALPARSVRGDTLGHKHEAPAPRPGQASLLETSDIRPDLPRGPKAQMGDAKLEPLS